jgi:ABC-2 type transport system ATP-binding protein
VGQGAREAAAPPLVTERLGRRFRRNRPWAVRDVSLEFPVGSITALVGANGAGKSTLIRSCLGFERPNEGRVLVFGIDPRKQRAAAIRRIGYVPQSAALYRTLTIADHFALAAVARPEFDERHARRHVARVDLTTGRRVGELSGGEQAQVTLAIVLGTRAPLLLLDEPLASLDPLARRDFLTALVADVRARGATAVLASHIVTDVEQACDRLVVLADGRLVLAESVADARARYRIVPAEALGGQEPIGRFAEPDGSPIALVEGGDGRAATLEEVVLGHLAAKRPTAEGAAA